MPDSPLFTKEDVENLRGIESSLIAQYPEDREILTDIADRLQQWIDQQQAPNGCQVTFAPGDYTITNCRLGTQQHLRVLPLPVIDETDLTEEG